MVRQCLSPTKYHHDWIILDSSILDFNTEGIVPFMNFISMGDISNYSWEYLWFLIYMCLDRVSCKLEPVECCTVTRVIFFPRIHYTEDF